MAPEGLPYLRAALHRESHGAAAGLSAVFSSNGATIGIWEASALGDLPRVLAILQDDADLLERPDAWEMRPLHWAAHCGHTELVGALLDRGAAVNAPADSWTPLHLAVELGHDATAAVLIARGADLHARLDNAHDSMTPLEMAEAWELADMATLLRPFYPGA